MNNQEELGFLGLLSAVVLGIFITFYMIADNPKPKAPTNVLEIISDYSR